MLIGSIGVDRACGVVGPRSSRPSRHLGRSFSHDPSTLDLSSRWRLHATPEQVKDVGCAQVVNSVVPWGFGRLACGRTLNPKTREGKSPEREKLLNPQPLNSIGCARPGTCTRFSVLECSFLAVRLGRRSGREKQKPIPKPWPWAYRARRMKPTCPTCCIFSPSLRLSGVAFRV